jgi:DNA-binding NarL/FixJ family response regulator
MIKVMIALQGRLYSEGLKSLIENLAGGVEVAGVVDDDECPYELAERLRPQVILTDTKTISEKFMDGAPDGSRLIVIGSDGEDLADLILNGTVCGALHDSSGPLTLETAIKAVSMGVVWMEGAWPKRRKDGYALREHNSGPMPA